MEKNEELINWLGYVDSLMVKDSETAIDVSRIISLNNTKYYSINILIWQEFFKNTANGYE